MDNNICNICGANYISKNGKWVCPACDNIRLEEKTNEEVVLLVNASTALRLANFQDAEELYSDCVTKYPKNCEGYWGRMLARYGIKYEDDLGGKKVPTVYATSIESVLKDADYIKALYHASADIKKYYEREAAKFEEIRVEWLEKASKQPSFDIFICFKDSDVENGVARTDDSYEAQELYQHLKDQGYSVFFSRESLRDKVAERYEPYIFNALNTARVMIVYSSKKEYIESTWVKNEWLRFQKKIKNGEKEENSLILAFDNMTPSEFPKCFSAVQCMNASKKTFFGDLDKHVSKVIKKATTPILKIERVEIKQNINHESKRAIKPVAETVEVREIGNYEVEQLTAGAGAQTRAALIFLSKGLFDDAAASFESILASHPHNADAIWGNILCMAHAQTNDVFVQKSMKLDDYDDIELAISYSTKEKAEEILELLCKCCLYCLENDTIDVALAHYDFVTSYQYDGLEDFDKAVMTRVAKMLSGERAEASVTVFERLLKRYANDVGQYLSMIAKYVIITRKQKRFDIAMTYCDKYLEFSETNAAMLWQKICITMGCEDEVLLSRYIQEFDDYATFEKLLSYSTSSKRTLYIDKMLNSVIDCIDIGQEGALAKALTVFDNVIKYTSKEDSAKYTPMFYNIAMACQSHDSYKEAEKYYAIIIGEDNNEYKAYWGLLQAKLKVKNDDELVNQPVIITTIPEFHSAIAAAQDERIVDKYIGLRAKQVECLKKQDEEKAKQAEKRVIESAQRKKKRLKRGIIVAVLCILVVVLLAIVTVTERNAKDPNKSFSYKEADDGSGYIVSFEEFNEVKELVVPNEYKGKPIVGIAGAAFKDRKKLRSIVLPDTIKSIGDNAFKECRALESITIPEGVTRLGDSVFEECRALESIALPEGLTRLGDSVFNGCSRLTSIALPQTLTSIGREAFKACSGLASITIPNSVATIGNGAFQGCGKLSNITIPNSVTSIGEKAFERCNRLTDIVIPDSVTNIGGGAFYDCSRLKSITLPFVGKNNKETPATHFGYIFGADKSIDNGKKVPSSLKTVVITGGASIGENAFYGCSELAGVTLPNSVTKIGSYAFSGCRGLVGIDISDKVVSIGEGAYEGCGGLTSIVVSAKNNVYSSINNCIIEKSSNTLIQGCKTSIIPDSVTSIGSAAFYNCSGLASVALPNSVISIGSSAFEGCVGLMDIVIPESVTSIGYSAFQGCSGLTSITLPFVGNSKKGSSETHFGYIFGAYSYSDNSMYVPSSLKTVVITGGTFISHYAFDGCSGLASIAIPDSVESIGTEALQGCTGLVSVTVPFVGSDKDGSGSRNFGCLFGTNLGVEHVPLSLKTVVITGSVIISESAFYGCRGISSITIPNSIVRIGSCAFGGCSSLTSITIPDSVTSVGSFVFDGWTTNQTIHVKGRKSAPNTWDNDWKNNCTATICWDCQH